MLYDVLQVLLTDESSILRTCLECAVSLTHHKAALSTRHAQLDIDSDPNIQLSMKGIDEVSFSSVRLIKDSELHNIRKTNEIKIFSNINF